MVLLTYSSPVAFPAISSLYLAILLTAVCRVVCVTHQLYVHWTLHCRLATVHRCFVDRLSVDRK